MPDEVPVAAVLRYTDASTPSAAPTRGERHPVSDPHQPATPPGTDQADIERRAALAEVLGKEVWPADRDTLVAKAQEGNAPDGVLAQLRRLPEGSSSRTSRTSPRRWASAPSSSGSDMPSMKDPRPEALANVTEDNVETRAQLLPEEEAVEGGPAGAGRPRPEDPGRGDPRRVRGADRCTPTPTTPRAGTGSRRTPPTCPDVRHEHPVQLRWSDPDTLGHVNHARALSLLEDARLAMATDRAGA